jgi:hypothetical protein
VAHVGARRRVRREVERVGRGAVERVARVEHMAHVCRTAAAGWSSVSLAFERSHDLNVRLE